jgi:enterochelin esterase-like enzyme
MRIGVAALIAAAVVAASGGAHAALLPAGWKQIKVGPAGGTVWEGDIPGAPWGRSFTHSYVYLPPNVSPGKRYPVLYVLHGFYGSPSSIVYGIALGDTADQLIQEGRVRPFIMVAPSGNSSTLYGGEWTGPRESFVVDTVIPWTDAHLPTIRSRSGRAIAGLSAGAYGAVDIALRHPALFTTAESWSGYFKPIADGTLHGASRAVLAAHDPSQLVRHGVVTTRFFLSCGDTHDRVTASFARAFAHELAGLHIPHSLVLLPGGHNGKFWRAQLPAALEYAF